MTLLFLEVTNVNHIYIYIYIYTYILHYNILYYYIISYHIISYYIILYYIMDLLLSKTEKRQPSQLKHFLT